MRTIWKYAVPISDKFELEVPFGGVGVLDVHLQDGKPYVWLEVDGGADTLESLAFRVLGTGNTIRESLDGWGYIGTFVAAPFVWHLYCEQAKRG